MRVRQVLLSAGGISLVSVTAALLAMGACKSGEKPGAKPSAAPPVTAADLAPVFGTLGPEGVVPRQLVIELARPIAPDGSEEAAKAEGTQLTWQPKLDGELRRTGPSTLVFEPSAPFAVATTYTATLVAVRTADGKELRAPGGGWTYRFTTPGFALSRMSLVTSGGDGQKKDRYGTATVDLVFTAPVERESVEKRASFTVTDSFGRDAPVAVGNFQQQAPNTVRVSLHSEAMRPNRRLRLTLAAGAEQDGGPGIAPAARDEVTLPKGGDGVEVKAIFPAEATSGYYVEIVCNDEAAEGDEEAGRTRGHRWYWDRVTQRGFGQLSQRCVFSDDELADKLHVTPAVTFTTAPAGGGMRLFGDFKRGPYSFRLEAGARTLDGGVLPGDYEMTFSVPARSPQVTFVSKGRYLPRSAWKSLPVRHLNVDEV
ncbi:MAG TPA: Ig-like domain-containing protein, partial [Thermoanaerobaculia bacterium]|nr:Ig-like domain-containing protein [Thermoanaerobaculia bacterium]